jgi:hypothetical protein
MFNSQVMINIHYPALPAAQDFVALTALDIQGPPFTVNEGAAAITRSHRMKRRRIDQNQCTDAEVVAASLNEYKVL